MSGATGALIIAIVGVVGTLSSPIVTQRLSSRARREEFEALRIQRQEEYQRERERAVLSDKRACYIAMIATSRRYRVELMNYLHMVDRGEIDHASQESLEDIRRAYIASYAELQMTATSGVMEAVEPVTHGLSKAYRATKHLEHGEPESDGSFEEIREFLLQLWEQWRHLRNAMRNDLKVQD